MGEVLRQRVRGSLARGERRVEQGVSRSRKGSGKSRVRGEERVVKWVGRFERSKENQEILSVHDTPVTVKIRIISVILMMIS